MKWGKQWNEDDVTAYLRDFKNKNRTPDKPTDPQPDSQPQPKRAHAGQEVHPRYHIHIHQRRRRLIDSDGCDCKATLDGLVCSGLLPDDSSEWIEAVTFSQEKSPVEQTIIEIFQIVS